MSFQDLTEEVSNHQSAIDATVDSGLELMKHISSDEAMQLKDKLDSLQRRFSDLTAKGSDLLRQAQVALPLVQNFHESHARLVDWMLSAEGVLQSLDSSGKKESDWLIYFFYFFFITIFINIL